jgi:TetR/AcrR family transcriptional repressor of bet genes
MNPNIRRPGGGPKRRTRPQNREYRRRSLLTAAIRTVARYDIHGATVERICDQAGASRGLIAHYFESKEALLLEALEDWYQGSIATKRAIAEDTSRKAEDRLRGVAHSSFLPPTYSWEMAAAWQAFTNASRYHAEFARPIRRTSRRVTAMVETLFDESGRDIGIRIDARQCALGLYILDDGLWNSLATGKDGLSRKSARALCDRYIDGCLGYHN